MLIIINLTISSVPIVIVFLSSHNFYACLISLVGVTV
jgi:hypothetical protein